MEKKKLVYLIDLVMLDLHHALYQPQDIATGMYAIFKFLKTNSLAEFSNPEDLLRGVREMNLPPNFENSSSKAECFTYLLKFKPVISKLLAESSEAFTLGERTNIVTYSRYLKADVTEIILSSIQLPQTIPAGNIKA